VVVETFSISLSATFWKSKLIEADFTGVNLQKADLAALISAVWTDEAEEIGDADLTRSGSY